MAEGAVVDADLRRDSDRLDLAPLRYMLLQRSRMNMLELNREVEKLRGDDNLLQLESGAVRSERRHRAAITFQLAVEMQLADGDARQWVDGDAQRRALLVDALYYPSHLWDAGAPPVIDEKAFADHLRARLRLEEVGTPLSGDADAGARRQKPSSLQRLRDAYGGPAVDKEVLTGEALKLLRSMAQAVLHQLGPHRPDGWRARCQACAKQPGFRMPPREVLDSLLAGDESLIDSGPDPAQARWRAALRSTAKTQSDAEARIQAIEKALWSVLRTDAEQNEPDWWSLALLANHYRVLPTSPAITELSRARETLRTGAADAAHLAAPRQLLHDFAATLTQVWPTLLDVLWHAAYLNRVDLRDGLALLSRGLVFADTDLDGIAQRLAALRQGIAALGATWEKSLPSLRPPTSAAPGSGGTPALDLAPVRRAREALDGELTPRDWGQLAERAWDQALARLMRFCAEGRVRALGAAELLCHAAAKGPGAWLQPVASETTLRDWSRLLLSCCGDRSLPARLAGVALARLGAANAGPAQRDHLLRRLERLLGTRDDANALHEQVQSRGLWTGHRQAAASLLVICRGHSPLTEGWRTPPRRCVALVLTVEDLEPLLQLGADGLLGALPRPLHVVWEAPPDVDPAAAARLQLHLQSATGQAASGARRWLQALGLDAPGWPWSSWLARRAVAPSAAVSTGPDGLLDLLDLPDRPQDH